MRDAGTDFVSLHERRHGGRNAVKYGIGMSVFLIITVLLLALLLFFGLERLPVAHYLRRRVGFNVTEDVRMTIHQLVREAVEDVVDGKVFFFGRHPRVKQHLQEQVAQLTGQFLPVAGVNSFKDLVSLFQSVGFNRVEGLLAVPGAAAGGEQTFDTIKPYTLEETYEVLEAI